jgi:hypothetical protein
MSTGLQEVGSRVSRSNMTSGGSRRSPRFSGRYSGEYEPSASARGCPAPDPRRLALRRIQVITPPSADEWAALGLVSHRLRTTLALLTFSEKTSLKVKATLSLAPGNVTGSRVQKRDQDQTSQRY